jgi:DNA-binding response OmpR family regulator
MRTVLIADDDPNLRLLVSLALDTPDFRVIEARSGPEALHILGTQPADLIVVDWMMPGMSGIELVGELRDEPATAAIPIVMLTARTQRSDLLQATAAGVDYYLIKPFSPGELLETVERALCRSRKPTVADAAVPA